MSIYLKVDCSKSSRQKNEYSQFSRPKKLLYIVLSQQWEMFYLLIWMIHCPEWMSWTVQYWSISTIVLFIIPAKERIMAIVHIVSERKSRSFICSNQFIFTNFDDVKFPMIAFILMIWIESLCQNENKYASEMTFLSVFVEQKRMKRA